MSYARLEEMLAESGLPDDELVDLVELLAPLDELADRVPTPSAELAALFEPAATAPISLADRSKRAVAGALVLALSGVGATGLSAAANTLPRPIQQRVADFSEHYLPFDLPEPPPPGEPLGVETPRPPYAEPRPGDPEASRSAQQRTGIPGFAPARPQHSGRPPQAPADASLAPRPSASEQPSPASPAPSPTGSPSPSGAASPSGGPGGYEDDDGRPVATPTKAPSGKPTGKPGNGSAPGTGGSGPGSDAKPGGGSVPAPAGSPNPAPTLPDPPAPTVPDPTIPLPDPLPNIGPIDIGGTAPTTPGE